MVSSFTYKLHGSPISVYVRRAVKQKYDIICYGQSALRINLFIEMMN